MLDTAFLNRPLPGSDASESLSKDPRVFRSAQLAERGAYVEAAELAQALLEDGSCDIRVICHYLLGLFIERGVGIMAEVTPRIGRLLDAEFEWLAPALKRARAADSALSGMFRVVSQTCMFHAAQDDDTWKRWLESVDGELVERLLTDVSELNSGLERVLEGPRSSAQLVRFRRFLKDSLAPAVRRRERALKKAADQVRANQAKKDAEREVQKSARNSAPEATADDPGAGQNRVAGSGGYPQESADTRLFEHSPALLLLMRKLVGFERLMAKADMAKAAVVASDIRAIISDFDPVLYLPHLFTDFFERLSTSIDELMPYWNESDSPTWQALEHFYRADLERFIGE